MISFILVGALLFQVGCAKTVSTIRPEAHQDPELSLPLMVRVTLKQEVVIHGIHRELELSKGHKASQSKAERTLICVTDFQ